MKDYTLYENNQDKGEGVRVKVQEILDLLSDDAKLDEEREKAKNIRENLHGCNSISSSGPNYGGQGGGNSRYGGYGGREGKSGGGNYGGYSGKYGGSGSGGRQEKKRRDDVDDNFGSEYYDDSTKYDGKLSKLRGGNDVKTESSETTTKKPTEDTKPKQVTSGNLSNYTISKPGAKPPAKPAPVS